MTDDTFAGVTLDEYRKLLDDVARIEAVRAASLSSVAMMWPHQDVDALIKVIRVQADIISRSNRLDERIAQHSERMDEQGRRIRAVEKRMDEIEGTKH